MYILEDDRVSFGSLLSKNMFLIYLHCDYTNTSALNSNWRYTQKTC